MHLLLVDFKKTMFYLLLEYGWTSLVTQTVKNMPAVRETLDQFLGWEDPLEKGTATHSSMLAWRMAYIVHGIKKSWTQLNDFHCTSLLQIYFTCR